MRFSRQEYWNGLPRPSPMDPILSELSAMTHASWRALHSMACSFIELDKAVIHVISVVTFLWLVFILSALWWIRIRGLWKLPDGRDWGVNWALFWWVGALFCKSLIQFSTDGQGYVSSLLSDLSPNYGGDNEDNGDLLQKVPCTHCYTQAPNPAAGQHWPTPPLKTPGHSWTSLGQSPVGSLLLSLGSGAHKLIFVPSKSLFPQSCVSSGGSMVGLTATSSKRAYAIPRSSAPRAPAFAAVYCWPVPPQETLKHSSVSVSVGSLGPGVHKVCLNPLSVSGSNGVWF